MSEIGSHHPHIGRHDGTPLARPFHELLCTLLAEAQAEGRGDADRAADDVAKGYGQQVLDQESFAPEKIASGIMNMFATECSRLSAMNDEMQNQIGTILPAASLAKDAR